MFISNFLHALNWRLHQLLMILGLRRHQQYFGTVYDSVTKQPLDPAVVKLIEVTTGEVVETSVTDMAGHYGFFAFPGRYKIMAKKSNYQFPSHKVLGSKDDIYENLYHGELFDLLEKSDVIDLNIPMDPLQPDWNQEAKQSVVKFSPRLEHFLNIVAILVFWFVLILALIQFYLSQQGWIWVILGLYVLIFLLAFLTPKPRLWGRAFQADTGQPLLTGKLELSHPQIPSIVIAKSNIFHEGKFFLRVEPGTYLVKISGKASEDGQLLEKSLKMRVDSAGVVYKNIAV